jgi:hypothetical protein
MAFTWYIPNISPPCAHVCDIGSIYLVYIYLVYTHVFPDLVYTWYIPVIYQNQPEGIYLVYMWYILGTSWLKHLGIYLVYIRYRLNLCHFKIQIWLVQLKCIAALIGTALLPHVVFLAARPALVLVLLFNALLLGIGSLHSLTHCGLAVAGCHHRRRLPSQSKSPLTSQVSVTNDEVAQRCHSKHTAVKVEN